MQDRLQINYSAVAEKPGALPLLKVLKRSG